MLVGSKYTIFGAILPSPNFLVPSFCVSTITRNLKKCYFFRVNILEKFHMVLVVVRHAPLVLYFYVLEYMNTRLVKSCDWQVTFTKVII